MKSKYAVLALMVFMVSVATVWAATVTLSSTTLYWGDVLTITILDASPGEKCGIEIEDPYGSTVYLKEVEIGSDGTASAEWGVPTGSPPGTYSVYVSCDISGSVTPPGGLKITVKKIKPVGGVVPYTLNPVPLLFLMASIVTAIAATILKRKGMLP